MLHRWFDKHDIMEWLLYVFPPPHSSLETILLAFVYLSICSKTGAESQLPIFFFLIP